MSRPRILVTGATGKTGAELVRLLRAEDWPVRAVVRRHDRRSSLLESAGAEVVTADLYDADQLRDAMRGTARAYFCPPMHPHMLQAAVAFTLAAADARLEQVVLLSQWLASPRHPALLTRHSWFAEGMLPLLGETAWTVLDPGFFADNYLRLAGFAAHLGLFPSLTGASRNAPPSNTDIARVAASVLAAPQRHHGRRYRPTGPALLSTTDMAGILSRVFGRRVRELPMPEWLFVRAARMQGVAAYDVAVFLRYCEDHRQGAFALAAPTDDVREVTGTPAESFEATARRYAMAPDLQRTPARVVRAWLDFMRTPLARGYDLARLDRELQAPPPASGSLAMHDTGWRGLHEGRAVVMRPGLEVAHA